MRIAQEVEYLRLLALPIAMVVIDNRNFQAVGEEVTVLKKCFCSCMFRNCIRLVCKHLLLKAFRAKIPLSSLAVGSCGLHAHGPQPQPWTYDEVIFSDEEINSSDEMNI